MRHVCPRDPTAPQHPDAEDVFYAERSYVMLHTVRGEGKTVRLPHRTDVWEVYSGRPVGRDRSIIPGTAALTSHQPKI